MKAVKLVDRLDGQKVDKSVKTMVEVKVYWWVEKMAAWKDRTKAGMLGYQKAAEKVG